MPHNRFWRSAIMITLCAHPSVAGTPTIRIIERGETQGLPPAGWLLTTVPDIHATAILHASEANPRRGQGRSLVWPGRPAAGTGPPHPKTPMSLRHSGTTMKTSG
jgi:hypothetical protein